MSRIKKTKLFEVTSSSVERNSEWLAGFDDTVSVLKPHLEELGFRLLKVDIELEREERFDFLQKSKVDFYVTTKPKGILKHFCGRWPVPDYNLLVVDMRLLNDPAVAARAIEGAILHDRRLSSRWYVKSVVYITPQYVTWLPKIKKQGLSKKRK